MRPGPTPSASGHDLPWLERAVAAGAAGAPGALREALASARSHSVGPARLREALRMLVPYAGYPRALAAFAAAELGPAPEEQAREADPAERASAGREVFGAVYGATAERVLQGLAALDPLLPAWTLEHAYGRVLARGGLTLRERELLAVSMLAALGNLEDPLLGHMRGAVRLGASPAELAAAIAALPEELGEDRRRRALALLDRVGRP